MAGPAAQASGPAAAPAVAAPAAQVTAASRATYKVPAKMAKAYRRWGGVKVLGRPTAAARCNIPAGGCLQRYQHGVLYVKKNGKYWGSKVRNARGEMLVVARSEIGYKQRGLTKYQKWVGSSMAWCGFFQEWVAYASGNPKVIPPKKTFASLRKHIKANWKPVKKIRSGTYALVTGSGFQSHIVMVSSVTGGGKKVRIVEGNWGKQVYSRVLTINRKSMFFYEPDYSRGWRPGK